MSTDYYGTCVINGYTTNILYYCICRGIYVADGSKSKSRVDENVAAREIAPTLAQTNGSIPPPPPLVIDVKTKAPTSGQ